jgi:hydroxymethylbilane synthase
VSAERAFLRRLEGGCQVPVAALAELGADGATLRLRGRVVALLGERAAEGSDARSVADVTAAEAMGVALAERLLGEGAAEILAEVRAAASPPVTEP